MPTYELTTRQLSTRPRMYLLATAISICASLAGAVIASPVRAASPYVIDGIALEEAFKGTRGYQCSPSQQFAEFTWCRRTRHERGRRGAFSSTDSILHSRSGVAYVSREIRPAFFAEDDIESEIKRLSARFGSAARELRLPEREGVSNAVIAVWGSVELEPLDADGVAALQSGARSAPGLLIDHLGDKSESIRLGLPVYRLKGGPGYLWSAMSDRAGRGYLRFLAMDGPALAQPKDAVSSKPVKDAAGSKGVKEAAAVSGTPHGVALASNDLRAFLTPQPTSALVNEGGKSTLSRSKDAPQQSIVPKTRADAERARLIDAERMAAEEREKARLAWARFEAEAAAHEANARLKWIVLASLFTLGAVLILLRSMARRPEQQPSQQRLSRSKTVPTLILVWIEFGCDFLQRVGARFMALLMRARATPIEKSILVTHGHG